MKQKIFIGTLLCLSMTLAACAPQASNLPTSAPAATQAPTMTEAPAPTDTPVAQTAEPTQANTTGGSASSSDNGYGASTTPSTGEIPVTGDNAIHSQNGSLGNMLVDAKGMTLYIFLKDTQNANTSACTATCANNWPALTSASAGQGVDASLLGSFQRADGSTQVTYNGWPLYYFAGDQNPGDVNGQGLLGSWFVVSPTGEAIQ